MIPIRLRHSLLRNLILPAHSFDQFAFSLSLVAGIYWLMSNIGPNIAIYYTFASWCGLTAAALTTAPAIARISPEQFAEVRAKLDRWHFHYRADDKSWVAPLPRWLRWSSAKIEGDARDGMIDLTGPRLFLKRLLPLSDTRLFVSPLW